MKGSSQPEIQESKPSTLPEENSGSKSREEASRVLSLQEQIRLCEEECTFLRCSLIMDNSTVVPCPPPSLTYLEENSQFLKFFNDLNQFAEPSGEVAPLAADNRFTKYINQILRHQDEIRKEICRIREENEALCESLEVVTMERNKNKESLAALEDEVDTCKQVIDFLVSQRDETKKAIGKTDEQLLDYRNGLSQNRDILVRVQNPMFGGPKDRTSSPTK